jgi:NADPH2:quinone reductase
MKAMLCKALGHPSNLILEEIASPVPKPNEVLISVKACSVNYPDTLIVQGLYQFKPDLPFAPGSDVAGIVKAVGEEVKHFKVGDKVFGVVQHGGFAEEVVVPSKRVFAMLPGMDFKTAASFMMAYATSYHALKDRAKLKTGETILILGASGGVGLAAVELAKKMGATVIAAASTDEKLALCKKYGADLTINYTKEDLKKQTKALTKGKGVDVVYDPVGGDYTEAALRATAWQGRFLIVGFPAGIAKVPMNLPLLKGCSIMGVFWSGFVSNQPKENMKNIMELVQMYAKGEIKPHIDKVYPLADAKQALIDMMERKTMGKIIIEP